MLTVLSYAVSFTIFPYMLLSFFLIFFYLLYLFFLIFDLLKILGGSFTMYDEAFPLFTMSEVEKGGLGFSTKDILFYLFLFIIFFRS